MKIFSIILFIFLSVQSFASVPTSHYTNVRYIDGYWIWTRSYVVMRTDAEAFTEEVYPYGYRMAGGIIRWWTNYTWSTSNGNILINTSNYPTLTRGDSVKIINKSGGYRSFTVKDINSGLPDTYITIWWDTTAYITPTTSGIQANSIDNIYGVKIYGYTMNDHIDPAFVSYSNGHYSQYVWFDHFTLRGTNAFFPFGARTLTTPDFTGAFDTVNCFYKWKFTNGVLDSLIGANSGLCGIWIGQGSNITAKNQVWIDVEISGCYFAHYSSQSLPSSYISASTVYGLKIFNNRFVQLGMNVFAPNGHTQSILTRASLVWIFNNEFGPDNFGNDWRNLGCGQIAGWPAYSGTNGISWFVGNVIHDKRKYPGVETYRDADDEPTLPWYQNRKSPEIWNCTFVGMAFGTGAYNKNDPYSSSTEDIYKGVTPDTATVKNVIHTKLLDSTWNTCAFMCNKLITEPNGAISFKDTINNHFVEFASQSGLADSTGPYYPLRYGWLYNQGAPLPSYITRIINADKLGSKRPYSGRSGNAVDIGAIQYPAGDQINRCLGCKVKYIP